MTDLVRASESSPDEFEGEILVGSRIIDHLSSGLYESPAACLKELVNNSHDADATNVTILVKPEGDFIVIEDDGLGMTRQQFETHFSRISESHKRDDGETTPSGRPKIGKIGIGFIAANELCDEMEIFSTVKGSTDMLHVTIDFEGMRDADTAAARKRVDGDHVEYVKGDFHGEVRHDASRSDQGTQIFLKRVRGEARDILAGAEPPQPGMRAISLYGLHAETIATRLASLDSWSSLDTYSQTRLGVSLNVPVPYHSGWLPKRFARTVRPIVTQVRDLDFTVDYDGTPLHKPIVLTEHPDKPSLLRRFKFQGSRVAAEGYLYAHHGAVRPTDLNGVLIRIRNAAVGEFRRDFLEFPTAKSQLFQRWITAEIYADDRLESALNIDRRTLRVTDPAYLELREHFHAELTSFMQEEVRVKMYGEGAQRRKKEKAKKRVTEIHEMADAIKPVIGPAAAKKLVEAWDSGDALDGVDERRVSRQYTVAELYKVCVDVATEVLPPDLTRRFVSELTKRLNKSGRRV